jgi:putative ABC transport system permease protein
VQRVAALVQRGTRRLVRSPGFSLTATTTLTIGLASLLAGFTLVQQIVFRPLPYPGSTALVIVSKVTQGSIAKGNNSEALYAYYRQYSRSFLEIGAYAENVVGLSDRGDPEQVNVAMVTWTVFSMLDIRPVCGRVFSPSDDAPGGNNVVVISEDLWQRRYGRDPSIIGKTIELNRAPKEVVGVLPRRFAFPNYSTQIWYPLGLNLSAPNSEDPYLTIIGRLSSGASSQAATAELERLVVPYHEAYPEILPAEDNTVKIVSLKDAVIGETTRSIQIVFAVGCFVLLLIIANLTNLFLVRAEHRRHEVAIKEALGAGRATIASEFFAESLLLVAFSALVALGLVFLGIHFRFGFTPDQLPRLNELAMDNSVLMTAAGLATLIGLLFSTICYLRVRQSGNASSVLVSSYRTVVGNESVQRLIVAVQVAIALVLMVGALGMLRSLLRMQTIPIGMQSFGVVVGDVSLPFSLYPDYASEAVFVQRLRDAIQKESPSSDVAVTSTLPLRTPPAAFLVPVTNDRAWKEHEGDFAQLTLASPELFRATGISLILGRTFETGDSSSDMHPVIISAHLSRRIFGQTNSIDRRFSIGATPDGVECTVAGVVGDVPGERIGLTAADIVYVPLVNNSGKATFMPLLPRNLTIVIRSQLSAGGAEALLQRSARTVDPQLPVTRLETLGQLVADSSTQVRVEAFVVSTGAVIAVFLGILGIYGVTAYAVSRRTREIAVRVALGAQHNDVIKATMKQTAGTVLFGIAFGIGAALLLMRYMQTVMFEVNANDPLGIGLVSVTLLFSAAVATYVPIKHACKTSVAQTLRAQ